MGQVGLGSNICPSDTLSSHLKLHLASVNLPQLE